MWSPVQWLGTTGLKFQLFHFRVLEKDDDPAPGATYYDYDANFGVVLNETENPSPDFEDLQTARVPPSYDYSHFEVYNGVSYLI